MSFPNFNSVLRTTSPRQLAITPSLTHIASFSTVRHTELTLRSANPDIKKDNDVRIFSTTTRRQVQNIRHPRSLSRVGWRPSIDSNRYVSLVTLLGSSDSYFIEAILYFILSHQTSPSVSSSPFWIALIIYNSTPRLTGLPFLRPRTRRTKINLVHP